MATTLFGDNTETVEVGATLFGDPIDEATTTQEQGPFHQRLIGAFTKGGMRLGSVLLEIPNRIFGETLPPERVAEIEQHLLDKYGPGHEFQNVGMTPKYQEIIETHRRGQQAIIKSHPEWYSEPPKGFVDMVTHPDKLAVVIAESTPLLLAAGITTAAGHPNIAFGMMYAAEGQEAYDIAIADGATDEQANTAYHVYGSVAAVLENLQLKGIIKGFKGAKKAMLLNRTSLKVAGKSITKQAVKLAAQEAAEEMAQQGWQEATAKLVYGKDPVGGVMGVIDRQLTAGLVGGTMGLIPGLGGSITGGVQQTFQQQVAEAEIQEQGLTPERWQEIKDETGPPPTADEQRQFTGRGKPRAMFESEKIKAQQEAEKETGRKLVEQKQRERAFTPEDEGALAKPPKKRVRAGLPPEEAPEAPTAAPVAERPEVAPKAGTKADRAAREVTTVFHGTDKIVKGKIKPSKSGVLFVTEDKGKAKDYGKNITKFQIPTDKILKIEPNERGQFRDDKYKSLKEAEKQGYLAIERAGEILTRPEVVQPPKAGTKAAKAALAAKKAAAPKLVKVEKKPQIPGMATNAQKAQAHILQKEQKLSKEDFELLAGKSMADMTQSEASAFIDRLKGKTVKAAVRVAKVKRKPVVILTPQEQAEVMKSAKDKGVFDATMEYAERLGPAPKEAGLRKAYIKDLRAVALTKKRLKKMGIDKGYRRDEINIINELSSARYALGQAELKSGVPLRKEYSKIATDANAARLKSDDIVRKALKDAKVSAFSAALTRTENNNMANWLFESDPKVKAVHWLKMTPKAQNIAKQMQNILQGPAANEVREARWRLWDTAEKNSVREIERLEKEIVRLEEGAENPVQERKIQNAKDDIVGFRRGVGKIQPPNAPNAALEQGRKARDKGNLKTWIAGQEWGTRQAYFMSEQALDDLVDMASNMGIATTIEERAVMAKPSVFLREANTRTGAARVKGGSVVNATVSHLERIMTFNATYDNIQNMWESLKGDKLSKRDIGILKEFVDTALGKRSKTDFITRQLQKATRVFWRFHFANPVKSAWFVTRNLVQNIAYAPSQMSMFEWVKSTPLFYGRKALGKVNKDMSEAFTKEWKPKISQKRQMYRQFMLQDEGDIKHKFTQKAGVVMDAIGGLATMSDEINRMSVWPVLYTAAQRNAKLYKQGKISYGTLSNRLRLETVHATQRLELKNLLENNPKEFQAKYAEYKTENIHFKYETAFRSAMEQKPLSRIVGGLTVYPRGFYELAYQNSVKPMVQGIQTGNYRMAWQGLVGLMMLYVGADAARRLVEKITGKSAYGFFQNLFQYSPQGPGLGKVVDFFDDVKGISYSVKEGDTTFAKTMDRVLSAGFRLGELFVPISDAYINYYESSNNVYGARFWSIAKKKYLDEYGRKKGKKFRKTDRDVWEKIQHVVYGGSERPKQKPKESPFTQVSR